MENYGRFSWGITSASGELWLILFENFGRFSLRITLGLLRITPDFPVELLSILLENYTRVSEELQPILLKGRLYLQHSGAEYSHERAGDDRAGSKW